MSTVREQAIEAGVQAWMKFKRATYVTFADRDAIAAVVDAVLPLARANALPPASAVVAYRDAVEADLARAPRDTGDGPAPSQPCQPGVRLLGLRR